nr:protein FAM200A-like [Procambarus clarkii]
MELHQGLHRGKSRLPKEDTSSSHKKQRKQWNDKHIVFGFFRPIHEASNPFPPDDTHIVLHIKKPFTELENVVLSCLEVAADLIRGEKDAVKKVKQILLSDTTISRRSVMLADDLMEQLVKKLRLAASFGIQLDETTDIGEAQLIVYSRFPDLEEKTIVEHYLCCLQLGVETTTNNIFQELHAFIIEEGIDVSKSKFVATDGAKTIGRCNQSRCEENPSGLTKFYRNSLRDSQFHIFDSFMRECSWEHGMQATEQTLEVHMSHLVISHLTLMQENLDFYFPDSENDQLTSNMWMLYTFTDEGTDNCDALLELRADYSQKAVFKTFTHPMDFWVTLLDIPEYKDLAEQAIAIFVQMPTSYLCEQGFSSLVLVKTKKRNAILNLDPLMPVALENRLTPRFNLIADKVQQQTSN